LTPSRTDVLGSRKPRIQEIPKRQLTEIGDAAVELAEKAGLSLDPWEQDVLREALGESAVGKWSAFEVALVCARQNGKTEILIARILAGLFLLDERLIIFSAHQFDTALEAFQRLQDIIDSTPEFASRVKSVHNANGKEGITLNSGQRVKFKARTRKGGRGFTGDCLIYDEAMDLPETAHGSTLPTLSARPNPQVWYAASAVDQWQHENGVVLARLRERALSGGDDSLAYFEWSIDAADPEAVTADMARDPKNWAQANPALGIRISADHVVREQRAMGEREFAVERLGVGDWPRTDGQAGVVLPAETWAELLDPKSELLDPVFIAWDTTPNRRVSSVAAAGKRPDGLWHVEVIEHKPGCGWIPRFLSELEERHQTSGFGTDKGAAGGSLIPGANEALRRPVTEWTGRDYANACGSFFDAVIDGKLRHLGSPELDEAVASATKRPLSDSWAWARQASDISPLVAATLALWGAITIDGTSVYEEKELLVL
jgi:hypothetical protein